MLKLTALVASFVTPLLLVGCGGDTTAPAALPVDELLWSIDLNHRAITLSTIAPNDTLQLIAIPRRGDGNVLQHDVTTTYTASDTSVLVSPNGFVTAHAPTSFSEIEVAMSYHGVTIKDTVYVMVHDEAAPAPVTDFHLRLPSDLTTTARRCILDYSGKPVLSVDIQRGDASPVDAMVEFKSSDPSLITVDRYSGTVVFPCRDGVSQATVYAMATIYGVKKIDSLRFTIRPPLFDLVLLAVPTDGAGADLSAPINFLTFRPGTITIDQGGIVAWMHDRFYLPPDYAPQYYPGGFVRPPLMDVTFENPTGVAATTETVVVKGYSIPPTGEGGNIPAFTQDTTLPWYSAESNASRIRVRRFPTPGTYSYTSRFGSKGRIIVLDSTQH